MKKNNPLPLIICFLLIAYHSAAQKYYPVNRSQSPGKMVYYIDPIKGDDQNTGTDNKHAWKTFRGINSRSLSAGDRINVLPGDFHQSLVFSGKGTSKAPITLNFAPGTYNFFPDGAFKKQFHITNTNDVPYGLKAVALYINNSSFVSIKADGAKMMMRGKMIETCVDHSQNISINGISYDYFRPTVSELQVTNTGDHFADLQIHPDSKYSIADSLLTWQGEGWSYKPIDLWQVLDPKTGDLHRIDIAMAGVKYAQTAPNTVRAYFTQNPGFKTGLIYQNRDITRDCAGIFMRYSKNISLKNVNIYFMHGMGVVSQFCQNISMDRIAVRPEANSGKTCAAWADILHFSGCRGQITISNSYLSGANDDAINIHGTYLRIMGSPKPKQVLARFMHNQTYGFDAFTKGDSVAFIHPETLQQYSQNVVTATKQINDKDFLLTLKQPLPKGMGAIDVLENTTWTPRVWIHHDTIAKIPTRGVLVTSRRKMMIEHCVFQHPHQSGISVANDAANWYESGMVRDLTIRDNDFVNCGEPAIIFCPENTQSKGPVHQNITILNNRFNLQGVQALSAKSTANIKFKGNTIKAEKPADIKKMIVLKDCTGVEIEGNVVK
ncbi:MAG: right-handed parallel beta-helix repeat-containing protein [Mucilaginibacter sp.]|uniref:right-handed parallel beta-helix repeat-containing protein n=1 Tax=Mucilaginibacter sp. TaxID=1882438 RepID=UPI0031AAE7F6